MILCREWKAECQAKSMGKKTSPFRNYRSDKKNFSLQNLGMSLSKPYLPLDEILEIFQIKLATAKAVLKKHRVDTFSNKGKMMIHAKDFYKAYTKSFNPSLFKGVENRNLQKFDK